MKTFVKVVLLLIAVLLAWKLMPLVFGLGGLLFGLFVGAFFLGGSVLAILLGALCLGVAVLSPLWVPVLLIVGVIALLRDHRRRPAATP